MLTRTEPPRTAAVRARWAVVAVFAANGATIASTVVRIPSIKADAALGDAQIGLLAAVFGIAAVAAMQLVGPLAARVGSAPVLRAAAVLTPVALIGIGLADTMAELVLAELVLGTVHGCLDVAMNSHAVAVERTGGRPVLNGCHAAWSIGSVAGAVAGGWGAGAGMPRAVHFALVAGVLVPVALLAGRHALPAAADRRDGDGGPAVSVSRSWRAGWTPRLVLLGAMGAAVLTCEAAVASWSGVLLHEDRGASLGVAALGYVAFTGFQTLDRLVGDRVVARSSPSAVVRVGAAIAAVGLCAGVLAPWTVAAVAGFAVLGVGLATPLPVLFGVVGHGGAGGSGAAVSVARLTTMTYAGILLAPPVVGAAAQHVGLVPTLALLVPVLAAVSALAGRVRPVPTPR